MRGVVTCWCLSCQFGVTFMQSWQTLRMLRIGVCCVLNDSKKALEEIFHSNSRCLYETDVLTVHPGTHLRG